MLNFASPQRISQGETAKHCGDKADKKRVTSWLVSNHEGGNETHQLKEKKSKNDPSSHLGCTPGPIENTVDRVRSLCEHHSFGQMALTRFSDFFLFSQNEPNIEDVMTSTAQLQDSLHAQVAKTASADANLVVTSAPR